MPTNRNFGYTFFIIFFLLGIILFLNELSYSKMVSFVAVFFLLITFLNPKILYPLNILWFKLGLLLGSIITPIILSIVFFSIFLPFSIFFKYRKKKEYWQKTKQTKGVSIEQ